MTPSEETLDSFLRLCRSQAAVRRFATDPVEPALIERILDAATRAPSARNSQPWRFIVVRDVDRRRALGDVYAKAYRSARPGRTDATHVQREAAHLADHFGTAPVVIAVCLEERALVSADPAARYGSIFPAVQNLCLAARAAGLGTVVTTVFRRQDAAVRAALGVPQGVEVVTLVPVGWPAAGFPTTRRRPVAEVTYVESWGQSSGERDE